MEKYRYKYIYNIYNLLNQLLQLFCSSYKILYDFLIVKEPGKTRYLMDNYYKFIVDKNGIPVKLFSFDTSTAVCIMIMFINNEILKSFCLLHFTNCSFFMILQDIEKAIQELI